MTRCSSRALLVACAVLVSLGCQAPPAPELAAAQDAMKKAQLQDAERFAREPFTQGKATLEKAQQLVTQQDARFAPLRKYDEPKKLLATARDEFAKAEAEANQANQGLVFTGRLERFGFPASGVTLRWCKVTFRQGHILASIQFGPTSQIANPETKTDAQGRFLLHIHPSRHADFLKTDTDYSITFNQGMDQGMIHVGKMPFTWKFQSPDSKPIRTQPAHREDLGTITLD